MKTPVCDSDLRSGELCQDCRAKLKAGKISELDFEVAQILFKINERYNISNASFDKAIDHLSTHFNSKFVRRTVVLIKQGLSSGGRIAEILERTAQDVRNMHIIKKDIAASLLMYIIFLVFAASIGAPFLFSVSAKLIGLLEHVFAQLPDTGSLATMAGSSFIKPQPPVISTDQFMIFVVLSTIVTAICSGLMIGVIMRGNRMEGVRYIPLMLLASGVIFIVISALLDTFLTGMGGGAIGS